MMAAIQRDSRHQWIKADLATHIVQFAGEMATDLPKWSMPTVITWLDIVATHQKGCVYLAQS